MENKVTLFIGFMGSGKTSVGQSLASRIHGIFCDTDEWIEAEEGRTISEIFRTEGEEYFRDLETDLLRRFADGSALETLAAEDFPPRERFLRYWVPKENETTEAGAEKGDGPAKTDLSGARIILSVGGGLPVRPENRALMKEIGNVIYLKADAATLVDRLKDDTSRPLLAGGDIYEKITSLMEARREIYEEVADRTIATDDLTVREIARMIGR